MSKQEINENNLGLDIDYVVKFLLKMNFIFKLLRFNVMDDSSVNEKRPTMYLVNHGQGFWGIVDVLLALHYWYIVKGFRTPLYLISEEVVFKIPIIKHLALKAGLKNAKMSNVEFFLKSGASVVIPPGGDGELLKPVWMKNKPVFTKSMYINGKMILKTQTWFLDTALKLGVPIVPVGISGTHEMTPIFNTSFLIHKYSGMAHFRKSELLPGYPITLGHFINMLLFSLTPFSDSAIAWLVFIIANIYIDFLYTYPVIFRKIYIKFGSPIDTKNMDYDGLRSYERKSLRMEIIKKISINIEGLLREADGIRNDIFSKLADYAKFNLNYVYKSYNSIIYYMFKLYMQRYKNYTGDVNEYFIK